MTETKPKNSIKRLLCFILLFHSVTFLGALLFIYIEECHPNNTDEFEYRSRYKGYLERSANVNKTEIPYILNITDDFFATTSRKRCVFDKYEIYKWWDFTIVSLYTIGEFIINQ